MSKEIRIVLDIRPTYGFLTILNKTYIYYFQVFNSTDNCVTVTRVNSMYSHMQYTANALKASHFFSCRSLVPKIGHLFRGERKNGLEARLKKTGKKRIMLFHLRIGLEVVFRIVDPERAALGAFTIQGDVHFSVRACIRPASSMNGHFEFLC